MHNSKQMHSSLDSQKSMYIKSANNSTVRSRSALIIRSYTTNKKEDNIEKSHSGSFDSQKEYYHLRQKQLEELAQRKGTKALYPPLELDALTMKQFIDKYSPVQPGNVVETETVVLRGAFRSMVCKWQF